MATDDLTTSPVAAPGGGAALLRRYIARLNHGVRSGDFTSMLAELTADAELVFEGIPVGPFRGRAAIGRRTACSPQTTSLNCCTWTRTATVVPAGRMPGPSAQAWPPARST